MAQGRRKHSPAFKAGVAHGMQADNSPCTDAQAPADPRAGYGPRTSAHARGGAGRHPGKGEGRGFCRRERLRPLGWRGGTRDAVPDGLALAMSTAQTNSHQLLSLSLALISTAQEYRNFWCRLETRYSGLGRQRQGQGGTGAGGEGVSGDRLQGPVPAPFSKRCGAP